MVTVHLCSRTREYRRLAARWSWSHPRPWPPWLLEIGCHEGITSSLLARRNEGRVLAMDRSAHAVAAAQQRFPALHLAVLDVASPRWEEDLTSELNALGVSWRHVAGCFVDLGGDARLSDVLRALGALGAFQEVEQGRWTVPVVVKSEALLRLYRNSQTEGGTS